MSFTRPSPAFLWLTCLALLLALGHAGLATFAMREKSTTADELAHVTGGYTFNHWNDYRLQPENGNLPQRWQALPAALAKTDFPNMASQGWGKSVVWLVGYDFFYQSRNDPAWLLFAARAMNSLFGAATVLLVFFWSYRLWGALGGVISAVFCALCPTMLAHSGLATSDMCMAFFLLAAPSAYWWHLHDGRLRVWFLSALVLGLATVAKFTAVLLLPIFIVLALARFFRNEPLAMGGRTFRTPAGRIGAIAASTFAQGLIAITVIWLFFGFRYSAFNPSLPAGEFNLSWDVILDFGGWKASLIKFCRHWHLLPEGWLYGLSFVFKFSEARGAFLDGDYSIFGWVEFFPKTFLYKTPFSLMAGLLASVLLLGLRLRSVNRAQLTRYLYQASPLLILFGVYWLFSLTSHLNIGHRHILPTYPVLYIFCGALGWAVTRAWRHARLGGVAGASIVLALLGWHAAVAKGIYPHYLAYFNPLADGPAEGYRHLVDSSLDWGQDLPALKEWLSTHHRQNEPVYLSYFGSDEPARYVPEAVLMPRLPSFDRPRPWYWCEPGLYAISATMLQHVYMPERAIWNQSTERQYQQLRSLDASFRAQKNNPAKRAELLLGLSELDWADAWSRYELLRFARLCYYLRDREPDGLAGYSIRIYRLSEEDLVAALDGDARALLAGIERARRK